MVDYGHDLQYGFFLDPSTGHPERTVEIARILDELGYDLIGVQDHPYQQKHFDAMALMAYILGQTERVRVFPDVANLPLRSPLMLAKEAATLDQLSGGRFELVAALTELEEHLLSHLAFEEESLGPLLSTWDRWPVN